jgi:hypothetical protein
MNNTERPSAVTAARERLTSALPTTGDPQFPHWGFVTTEEGKRSAEPVYAVGATLDSGLVRCTFRPLTTAELEADRDAALVPLAARVSGPALQA